MSPVVRISDESYLRLKAWAEPLDDTADDAFQKVLDAADKHRQFCEIAPTNSTIVSPEVPCAENMPDNSTSSIRDGTTSDELQDALSENQGRLYVSLPDEFKLLGGTQRKERGILARKAYLERIDVPSNRPNQWVATADGKTHFVGYASKLDRSDRWFIGADENLVKRHIEDGTLGSFVFLCGLSERMMVAVPANLEQLKEMVRLGIFATNKNQLKFHVKREADDLFYLDGRLME